MMYIDKRSSYEGGLGRCRREMVSGFGFPEMIEMLRSQWNESTTFPSLVELCAMLDGALQRHRPTVRPSLPPGSQSKRSDSQ